MKKCLFIFFVTLSLVACATFYGPLGLMGGYSETRLDKDLFRVSFRGNGFTRLERALDFTLLRSSELSLQNGFKYFVIVYGDSYVSSSNYISPATTQTRGQIQFYGNYAYASATSTTYGGQVYNIKKPRITIVILCFEKRPDLEATVFNAEYIRESIESKYKSVKKYKYWNRK